jgi:spore coat protein U-like protein
MRTASGACVLVILVSGIVWKPAFAVTPVASFSVTATVVAGCRVSASAMALRTDKTMPANAVSVICSNTAPYNVGFGTTALPDGVLSSSPAISSAGPSPDGRFATPEAPPHVITITIIY